MKNVSRIMPLVFSMVFFAQAKVLRIPFSAGKQSGTFQFAGTHDSDYVDTVIIDSNLFITNYLGAPSGSCSLTFEFGLLLRTSNGVSGKGANNDTVWTNAKIFPNNLFPLDSIPSKGLSPSKYLGINPQGLKVGTYTTSPTCSSEGFITNASYNVTLYFGFNQNSLTRYGKIAIYGYQLWDDHRFPSNKGLLYLSMAYTISDTKDLNTGPVPLYLSKSSGIKDYSIFEKGFDLLGRKAIWESNRAYHPIPLLVPKE